MRRSAGHFAAAAPHSASALPAPVAIRIAPGRPVSWLQNACCIAVDARWLSGMYAGKVSPLRFNCSASIFANSALPVPAPASSCASIYSVSWHRSSRSTTASTIASHSGAGRPRRGFIRPAFSFAPLRAPLPALAASSGLQAWAPPFGGLLQALFRSGGRHRPGPGVSTTAFHLFQPGPLMGRALFGPGRQFGRRRAGAWAGLPGPGGWPGIGPGGRAFWPAGV